MFQLLVWSFDQQSRLGFTLERIDTVLSAIFVVSSLHFYLIIIVSTIKKVISASAYQVCTYPARLIQQIWSFAPHLVAANRRRLQLSRDPSMVLKSTGEAVRKHLLACSGFLVRS